ncbi:type VII secretion protein EsaA [Priestia koreensis]|uniref:type VII secretion protein EsaA n=1 Tax=Priestia koreensis TaxID=284581 RepID=UPI001F57CD20|nr:type VII secretion protein EsaA [Priestia koreensis]UNL86364.1 type VII secretion protein EsaA [Priestia koreensis]
MSEKQRYGVKLVLAIVLILALPALFFQYVGDNPLKVSDTASGQIAVVNEDRGVGGTDGGKEVDFGAKVAPILQKDSQYEWKNVTRSVANQGLKSGQYEAVVYIPSNYSSSALTYTDNRPEKASLQYRVQSRLTSVDKQKVVRELEAASSKASNEITSRYWNYVAQEMDDVRGKFDNILDKEIKFQKTMLAFYKPGSKDLAGELDNQKKTLEQIQESVKNAEKGSATRKEDVQQIEANLESFVQYVDQYKAYQEAQDSLLQQAQAASLQSLQTSIQHVGENQEGIQALFQDQTSQVSSSISSLEQQLQAQSQMAEELQVAQADKSATQESDLKTFNNDLLDQYRQQEAITAFNELEEKLMPLRKELQVPTPEEPDPEVPGDGGTTPPGDGGTTPPVDGGTTPPGDGGTTPPGDGGTTPPGDGGTTPPGDGGTTPPGDGGTTPPGDGGTTPPGDGGTTPPDNGPSFEAERAELTALAAKVSETKKKLEEMTGEKTPEVTEAIESLTDVAARIEAVEKKLAEQASAPSDSSELQQKYDDLQKRFAEVQKQLLELQQQQNNGDLQKLQKAYDELSANYNDLNERYEALKAFVDDMTKLPDERKEDVATIVALIKQKEERIQSSYLLSDERKQRLQEEFSPVIQTSDIKALIDYNDYLSKYEQALNQVSRTDTKSVLLNSDGTNERVGSIVYGTGNTEELGNSLKENVDASKDQSTNLNDVVANFVEQYQQTIAQEQSTMITDLTQVQDRANTMTEILQQTNDPKQEADPNVGGLVSLQRSMGQELQGMNSLIESLGERQDKVVTYTGDLQKRVNDVQAKADELNTKWAKNVDSTKLVHGDVYKILSNTSINGQPNNYVYNYLANPVQIKGDVPAEKIKEVPPVVIMVIILISSLLIGYFSHYYRKAPLLVRAALFGLLNLIVGLMISIFSLNIYTLSDDRSIQWSVYTILLLVATSLIVQLAFLASNFVGWIVTVILILFFITPLLTLSMPNFGYEDPVSKVYMSIQYDTHTLFTSAVIALVGLIVILAALPAVVRFMKSNNHRVESDETYDA